MAGRIPQDFIDALLQRVDVVDVVNARVPLKKAGRNFQARCPFHDEKTPSFSVSPDKQFYHCFGCGAHGSAIGFLMEYEHMGFVDAVEELASRVGMEVPHDKQAHTGPDLKPLYALLEQASSFYQAQLRQQPLAQHAVSYLKDRGLSGEIASEYHLGFAPPGWRNLIQHLGNDKDQTELLQQTGMLSEREGRFYDRFRNRIMFPIRDQRGRTIGFGGRVLGDDTPKYLNSPETPVFHKGRELYGLYEARKALHQLNRLIVVEGYMDVIALAQSGIRYAVATLGTATTDGHLERLYRAAPEIIFCFDGDRAGREAAWKALNTALPHMREGREARFLYLPENEDPDSLIRAEGGQGFTERLTSTVPLSQFLFDKLSENIDMQSLDGRARLVQLARPYLAKLPPGIFRDMMRKRLAELVDMDIDSLAARETNAPDIQRRKAAKPATAGRSPHMSPVRMAVALLLQHPHLAAGYREIDPPWKKLDAPGIPLLTQLLDLLQTHPTLKQGPLLEHWRDTEDEPYLHKLISLPLPVPDNGVDKEFSDALQRLTEKFKKQEANKLKNVSRLSELTSEEKQQLKELLTVPGSNKPMNR